MSKATPPSPHSLFPWCAPPDIPWRKPSLSHLFRRLWLGALWLVAFVSLAACGLSPREEYGSSTAANACGPGSQSTPGQANFSSAIDPYASYVGQSTCDPTPKPGVVAFRDFVLSVYPCTGSYGISRNCSTGGKSEHKEGRAWDWKLQYPHPAADAFLAWLLATDKQGNKHAMARRLGIMYMIWNRKIWSSYKASAGWASYNGSSPHTDHVHFSFSWDAANKKTSFWKIGPNGCDGPKLLECQNKGCGCKQMKCRGGSCCDGTTEKCDGQDNDCDGKIDNGNPGGGQNCTTGQQGICSAGVSQCVAGKIVCQPKQSPAPQEICDDQLDNNCNGQTDEGCTPPECTAGQTRPCYSGPANTRSQGICHDGTQSCSDGAWETSCTGETLPAPQEICDDQLDNNCNGQTDEGCSKPSCTNGQTRPCYSGPANTRSKGICHDGTQTCSGGAWSSCAGETLPAPKETCKDQLDNNCNGQTDEGCSSPSCVDKDGDGYFKGDLCPAPVDCNDADTFVHPHARELCNNQKDDNCNGQIDEGCNGAGSSCQDNKQCPSGALCLEGQCRKMSPRGCGCHSPSSSPPLPPLSSLLLLAFLLLRRRRRKTQLLDKLRP